MAQKKHSNLILVAPFCIVAAFAVLAFHSCTNTVHPVQAESKKQTESYSEEPKPTATENVVDNADPTPQSTRLKEAIQKADSIKQKEENEQWLKTICDEYIKKVNSFSYSSEAGYFLFDIDKNGVPELWLKTGTYEANYRLRVYSYDTDMKLLYSDDAGHSDFYQGNDYVIKLYAHMGDARWDKLAYDGNEIVSTTIYQEDINGTDRDYREPTEKWIELYSHSEKQPILDAFQSSR